MTGDGIIRVALVDDDPFVRASLATILGIHADIEVCGEGGDGPEAEALFESAAPDILLMDIQMPGGSGLEAAEHIMSRRKDARIVFLTTFSDDEYIVRALRLGARGYLIKQEVATIATSLRAVMAGQMVLGGEVVGKVDALVAGVSVASSATHSTTAGSEEPPASERFIPQGDKLTTREQEIMALIAQGLDNREIAATVFISEGTLRNHISVMLQKLGLKNRTQLAVCYYRNLR